MYVYKYSICFIICQAYVDRILIGSIRGDKGVRQQFPASGRFARPR